MFSFVQFNTCSITRVSFADVSEDLMNKLQWAFKFTHLTFNKILQFYGL